MDFAMLKPFACVCFKVITSLCSKNCLVIILWVVGIPFLEHYSVVSTPRNQVDYWLFRNSESLCSLSKYLDTHRGSIILIYSSEFINSFPGTLRSISLQNYEQSSIIFMKNPSYSSRWLLLKSQSWSIDSGDLICLQIGSY